jgi:predicted phosphohydrolase
MPRLFALADLHLSLGADKPMDIFGEAWRDHPRRMAEAWDALVEPDDTVLLPGDLSWGRNLAEAAPDLAWIEARPGRKLLLKGNHDSWWRSPNKARQALPPCCALLHNDAVRLSPWVVVGARGWLSPADPAATESDAAVYRRELERLRLSIESADEQFGREEPRLALVHYPPRLSGSGSTPVVEQLVRGGVRAVAYGHLHGPDHALAIRGECDGIDYHFVAADAVGFTPVEIRPPSGSES